MLTIKPCTHGQESRQEKNFFPNKILSKNLLPPRVYTLTFSKEPRFSWKARTRWRHGVRRACALHNQCHRRHLAASYLCLGSYRTCVKVFSSMHGFPQRPGKYAHSLVSRQENCRESHDEKIENRVNRACVRGLSDRLGAQLSENLKWSL